MDRRSRKRQSQTSIESLVDDLFTDQINELVRYFLYRAGEQVIFKRTDLKKNVLPKSGNQFQDIFNSAVKTLHDIYGYDVKVIDSAQSASAKSYFVTNSLQYFKDPGEVCTPDNYPEDVNKILTFLVLSHIFMNNNSVSEQSLSNFLKPLGIDVIKEHPIFGTVKEFIHHTLKSKKYIHIETDQASREMTYSWGPRAEKEISKHDILKFVCKMYNIPASSSWDAQFKEANEQHTKNQNNHYEIEQPTQCSQR